jgi:hypothetical protein
MRVCWLSLISQAFERISALVEAAVMFIDVGAGCWLLIASYHVLGWLLADAGVADLRGGSS